MLINLRNALMAGKRLPYDAEVEYLESTGTQWIDTGVPMSSQITITARLERVSDILGYYFGAYDNRVSPTVRLSVSTTEKNTFYFLFSSDTTAEATPRLPSGFHDVTISKTGWQCDGEVTSWRRTDFARDSNIFVFGRSINGNIADRSRMRVASLQILSGGVLVRDYIPVRRGTVGYLYDRVSGKLFGNAGTGDFVLGQDVVPVEWLSSDGNQYIDTGYVFQFGDDVSATFQPLATPTQTAYFFGADTAYNAGLNVHYDPSSPSTGLRYCYGGGFGVQSTGVTISPAQAFSTSTIYACNGNSNKRTINSGENTAVVQDSGLNSASMILFCGRRGANIRPASAGWAVASRFFGFDAKRNGAGVCAMKPVRVGTDATSWEGAMMDVLTRRIYRNAGTGAFTFGNDLKYPIPAS